MLKQKCSLLLFGEDSMDESGLHFGAIVYRKTVVLQSLQERILLEGSNDNPVPGFPETVYLGRRNDRRKI